MELNDLNDIFVHELKQMYYVENRLMDELESMQREVTNDALSENIEEHRKETMVQIERLEGVFEHIDEMPEEEESKIFNGLFEETQELNESITDPEMLNLAYLNSAIKVERLEITAYEGLIQQARELDLDSEVEDLLMDNFEEEKSTLEDLRKLSKGSKLKKLMRKVMA